MRAGKGMRRTDIRSRVVFMKQPKKEGQPEEGEWTFLVPPPAWTLDPKKNWNGWVFVSDGVSDASDLYNPDKCNPTMLPPQNHRFAFKAKSSALDYMTIYCVIFSAVLSLGTSWKQRNTADPVLIQPWDPDEIKELRRSTSPFCQIGS